MKNIEKVVNIAVAIERKYNVTGYKDLEEFKKDFSKTIKEENGISELTNYYRDYAESKSYDWQLFEDIENFTNELDKIKQQF